MIDYEDGYKIILWLQSFQNPVFDAFFVAISALGVKEFYILAIPLVYWCVDKRLGARLCFIFLIGMFLNSWVKHYVRTDRPLAARVRVLYPESGGSYSFPSGHAQGSLAFWGYAMLYVKKTGFSVFCVSLIASMCVSRMYLGLHFPFDVIGGIVLGIVSLLFFFILLHFYEKLNPKLPWTTWLLLVILAPVLFTLFFPQTRFNLITGAFLGFFSGVVLEERFVGFKMNKTLMPIVKKLFFGMGTAAIILLGLDMLLEGWKGGLFVVYAVSGFWVSFGAPWCFKRWGLG